MCADMSFDKHSLVNRQAPGEEEEKWCHYLFNETGIYISLDKRTDETFSS